MFRNAGRINIENILQLLIIDSGKAIQSFTNSYRYYRSSNSILETLRYEKFNIVSNHVCFLMT